MVNNKQKLLVIGLVWPEPKSSAVGSRMLQLINAFKTQGYSITFATTSLKTPKSYDLERIGVSTKSILINHSSFDEFIINLNPHIVLFDRFIAEEQFGWRVLQHCPNAIRILDTEDLHCLRKAREIAQREQTLFTTKQLQNQVTHREIASIYRCDLSLIISEAEIDLLRTFFKVTPNLLYYLPFMVKNISEKERTETLTFNNRKHFVTIGNYLHTPNVDALAYLKTSIWPLILKDLPQAQLLVYGAYMPAKIKQLQDESKGFIIKGFVDDADSVISHSRVMLAPLRFGAGLKGKLIDAMKNGTPCVMTPIAAEGMFAKLPANGFIATSPEDFAKAAINLYQDELIWEEKQEKGFVVLQKRFDKDKIQDSFKKKLQDLIKEISTHRQNNIIGGMLNHHRLQSTKYLSLWIEEKNKPS